MNLTRKPKQSNQQCIKSGFKISHAWEMRKRESLIYQSRHQILCQVYSCIHTRIVSIQLQCVSLILVNMWILGPPINPLNFEQMEALFAGLFKMSLTSNCISTPNNNLWVGFFDFASVSTDKGKDKENYSPDCSNWINSVVSVLLPLLSRCSDS